MPKLSSYRRIITNDFDKDDKKLVEKMASPLNDSFNELYFAANGRLSLRDNIYCTVKDIDIIVDAGGNPLQLTSFNLDKDGTILGCNVLYAANQVNSNTYPTGQPFISFIQNGKSVIINNITGLQASQRYTIRIVAYLN
jgi:hypothetical protein